MNFDPQLVEEARDVRERAYAPYSNFKVGAAIRTRSGKVFKGANVENISISITVCAERSAGVAAISAGEMEWEEIAVVAGTSRPTSPCGACRQFLAEFNPNLKVVVANQSEVFYTTTVAELLPKTFDNETYKSQAVD
ncbi:MAG: cytidine deaminase [Chloroflexi bacterium]|nr:cytidine deaminase [Chloroflexota bacterium]OJW03231.1 MAG: cytidine deaminase [Chloroflexi bacterium 54-19]